MIYQTNLILETLGYVKKFSGKRILIKIGGSVLNNQSLLKNLCEDLKFIKSANISIVLVHGGGKAINQALNKTGIESQFKNGLRITTDETIDIIEMVLSGHVNKTIVRALTAAGLPAIGVSGTDNNMITCSQLSKDYGYVGEINSINTEFIESLLAMPGDLTPVISPIGVDSAGNALNINADWAASYIASALNIHKLIYITDQNGILDNLGNVLTELDAAQLDELLKSKTISDGMLTKTKTILKALHSGLDNIHIINGNKPHALIEELFTLNGTGTICTKRTRVKSNELTSSHAA